MIFIGDDFNYSRVDYGMVHRDLKFTILCTNLFTHSILNEKTLIGNIGRKYLIQLLYAGWNRKAALPCNGTKFFEKSKLYDGKLT